MPTLTMLKGLPGSGKTTWARTQKAKRVNKDDLRAMLDNGVWSKDNEKLILSIRNYLLLVLMQERKYDVICDDTNLAPKHEAKLRELAEQKQYDFVIKDFTDVPLEECIKRDQKRPNYVGEKVIKSMYDTFLKEKGHVAQYPISEDLPWCVIVDIDGTLAHMTGRSPFEWDRVDEDAVDETVKAIVVKYANKTVMDDMPENYIVVMSGRDEGCRPQTTKWLQDNNIPYDELHMRPAGDMRKDAVVKKELFDKWIKNRYNVRFVLDDRNQVVKMWREMGLKVLQCADGDF